MQAGAAVDFADFLSEHLDALSRFAGVLAGDRPLAEDVLSDALIAAMNRWASIAAMEFPAAYVRRMITTTYLADRRRSGRRRTVVHPDPGLLGPVSAPVATTVEDRDALDRSLASLPRRQRAAVVLRFYLDWPDTDIAAALDCSPATVRSLVARALTALRGGGDLS